VCFHGQLARVVNRPDCPNHPAIDGCGVTSPEFCIGVPGPIPADLGADDTESDVNRSKIAPGGADPGGGLRWVSPVGGDCMIVARKCAIRRPEIAHFHAWIFPPRPSCPGCGRGR